MRNIAFLVIVIITVAIAVSCNMQNSAGSKENDNNAGEKQVSGSVESPKMFTRVIERDNEDILNRLNDLQTSLNEKIDGININTDNTEVLNQIETIKKVQTDSASELIKVINQNEEAQKMRFYQLYGALAAVVAAIMLTVMLVYRYLRKFIAEKMSIPSYKQPEDVPAPQVSEITGEENPVVAVINETVKKLEDKIKDAKYIFDPEKAVKLENSQKVAVSALSTEIAFLKKAGYELPSKFKYISAVEKVNDKNYSEASEILESIKAADENYAPAFFLAGYIAYVSRKYETATENLKKACELDPANAAFQISYGNACLKEKKYSEAAEALKKAVEIKPDDASAWNNLAHAYIVSEKIDEAVEAFGKAAEIKPDFHEALHNLGLALGKLKKYSEALEAFEKAIKAKEDKHESMYNAACVYALLGKRDGALSNLKRAIELDADYAAKAKKDKDFSSFKNDEEFKKILAG